VCIAFVGALVDLPAVCLTTSELTWAASQSSAQLVGQAISLGPVAIAMVSSGVLRHSLNHINKTNNHKHKHNKKRKHTMDLHLRNKH
jgi:hypothetical protein